MSQESEAGTHRKFGSDDDVGASRSDRYSAGRSENLSGNMQKNLWTPHGLCTSPPSRGKTAPAYSPKARDRFIAPRAPLDSKLSNYLLGAPAEEQDFESTPTKQVRAPDRPLRPLKPQTDLCGPYYLFRLG